MVQRMLSVMLLLLDWGHFAFSYFVRQIYAPARTLNSNNKSHIDGPHPGPGHYLPPLVAFTALPTSIALSHHIKANCTT